MRSYGNRAAPRKNSTPYLILPVGKLNPLPCVQRAQKRSIRVLTFDSAAPSCSASYMIGELTELDVAVINALSARYSHAARCRARLVGGNHRRGVAQPSDRGAPFVQG